MDVIQLVKDVKNPDEFIAKLEETINEYKGNIRVVADYLVMFQKKI